MIVRHVVYSLLALGLAACSSEGKMSTADPGTPPATGDGGGADPTPMDPGPGDPGVDAGTASGSDSGTGSTPPSMRPPDWPESRAWRWVRGNPMFISGLVSQGGQPSAAGVARYFDDFGANAIHLWETALPDELAGWHRHRPGARWLTWLHGDGTNVRNRMVLGGALPAPPGRIGYQLGDEPGTWERMNEIMRGLAAVRTADPDGLRIVNYSWWADELDDYVDHYCESGLGDVISYDLYSRSNIHYESLAYFREAGLRCGMPYWRYIKGLVCDPLQSESDMRWAAFVGLTFGYTGHSWFIYHARAVHEVPSTFFTRPDDWASPMTPRFAMGAQLNSELAVYGRAITQLLSTDVAWATDVPLVGFHPPDGVPLLAAGMDPHLTGVELQGSFVDALLGFFVDVHGDRYVIVQNPNHSDGSFPTDDDSNLRATLRFDFSGARGIDTSRVMVLDGRSGRVRPQALTGDGLPVDIAAGDILFFKYDTGRAFAGY